MSLADLIFWEENFKAPKDKAAANVEEAEDKELPELEEAPEVPEVICAFLTDGWRLSWRAFARAFSWVRTKLARFWWTC